jgi:hypothetical protein
MGYFMEQPLVLRLREIEAWAIERGERAKLRGDQKTALRAAELETRAHNYDTGDYVSPYQND